MINDNSSTDMSLSYLSITIYELPSAVCFLGIRLRLHTARWSYQRPPPN